MSKSSALGPLGKTPFCCQFPFFSHHRKAQRDESRGCNDGQELDNDSGIKKTAKNYALTITGVAAMPDTVRSRCVLGSILHMDRLLDSPPSRPGQ